LIVTYWIFYPVLTQQLWPTGAIRLKNSFHENLAHFTPSTEVNNGWRSSAEREKVRIQQKPRCCYRVFPASQRGVNGFQITEGAALYGWGRQHIRTDSKAGHAAPETQIATNNMQTSSQDNIQPKHCR